MHTKGGLCLIVPVPICQSIEEGTNSFYVFVVSVNLILVILPQTLFVGGNTVFMLSVRMSVTFCFLNILKNH